MHVLITNDDGIDAPGLAAMEAAVADHARVTIVAPHQTYSGCGHQVTNHQAIRVEQVEDNRFKVFGTPADCTRIGISEIAPDVDWVVSGINAGANLGVDLVMSGTVASVREACWLGKLGIAISQYVGRDHPRDWHRSSQMAQRVLKELWQRRLETQRFWSVNLPDGDTDSNQVRMVDTFPEPKHLHVNFRVEEEAYRYSGNYRNRPRTHGSDVDVCFGGAISISKVSAAPQ